MAIAVVTGTTSGIGAALAEQLAGAGFGLVLVNRSRARTQPTVDRVRQSAPDAPVEVVEADLSDPEQIRRAAGGIAELAPRVGALFNNAGVLLDGLRQAPTGHEMHVQVNTFAPYLLTRLLRPQLEAASTASEGLGPRGESVVVNTNSSAVKLTGALRVDDLLAPPRFRKIAGPYGQSKLALLTLSQATASEYAASGVLIRDVAPGATKSVMTAGDGMPGPLRLARALFFQPPESAAERLVLAATSPVLGAETGLFVGKAASKLPIPSSALDPAVQRDMLALASRETGA